jgi:hypothetical protein
MLFLIIVGAILAAFCLIKLRWLIAVGILIFMMVGPGHATEAGTFSQCFAVPPTDGLEGGKLASWVIKKGFVQGKDDTRIADMAVCDSRHHTIHFVDR